MFQPDWLLWAWREFGVREVRGGGDNPRIVEMFKAVGHAAIHNDEVAWCAAFLGACLERSGRPSTRSLMARSYLKWGEAIETPRLGAIAVLSRGSDLALGHVGFIVGEADEEILLLGGNQADGVNVTAYPKDRLLAYRWPLQDAKELSGGESRTLRPAEAAAIAPADPGAPVFDRALAHVLRMEGGFSDDPHDPGGPTNKGITLGVYARWLGETVTPANRSRHVARLKRIPDPMVREIYETRYWQPAECRRMPAALAVMHFDAAVNHGVGAATRILQQASGAKVDGEIGPETRRAIAGKPVIETLVAYAEIRRERYRALKHFWRFGRGWMRRVDHTLIRAGELIEPAVHAAAAQPGSDAEPAPRSEEQVELSTKGAIEMSNARNETEATVPAVKWWGESLTIWGVIVTAAATVLPAIGPLIGIDITGEMVRQLGEQVTEVVQAIGGILGTLMAIYGRVRATQPIARRLVEVKL